MLRGHAVKGNRMDRLLQARLEEDPLLKQAVEWFLEMRSDDVSGERIAEWQQWLSHATNRQAFGRVEALWHLTDGATASWPTEAEVTADGYSGTESVAGWRLRSEGRSSLPIRSRLGHQWIWRRLGTTLAGVAAAAAVAFVAITYWPTISVALQEGSRITLTTGVGDKRTIRLPDGSVISAGADTDLVATLLERSRTVVLSHGEAYFHVMKDPNRPFTVRAGDATVTDVGTVFDVRRTLNGIIVAVAEGMVNVATQPPRDRLSSIEHLNGTHGLTAIQLTAGERLALEPFNTLPQLSSVTPNSVGGWRQGRLQYVEEPLDSVVADLARYSDRRIIIATPALANLRVTGVVYVRSINGWLDSLQATFPVRVQSQADGTTIIEQR